MNDEQLLSVHSVTFTVTAVHQSMSPQHCTILMAPCFLNSPLSHLSPSFTLSLPPSFCFPLSTRLPFSSSLFNPTNLCSPLFAFSYLSSPLLSIFLSPLYAPPSLSSLSTPPSCPISPLLLLSSFTPPLSSCPHHCRSAVKVPPHHHIQTHNVSHSPQVSKGLDCHRITTPNVHCSLSFSMTFPLKISFCRAVQKFLAAVSNLQYGSRLQF